MGVGAAAAADNDDDHIYANVPEVFGVANVSYPFSSHCGRTKLETPPKLPRAWLANFFEARAHVFSTFGRNSFEFLWEF